MLSSVLLWVAICTCVFLWWRARVRESRAHPLPPAMPGGLPITGHLHRLIFTSILDGLKIFEKDTMETGGVMHCKIGFEIYYVISDAEDALTVANNCVERHFLYRFVHSWLGEGLLTGVAGSKTLSLEWKRTQKTRKKKFFQTGTKMTATLYSVIWRRHRKLLHPVFGLPMIHGFLEVFNRQSRALLKSIDPYVGNGKTDLTESIKKIIFQTSCLTAFGEINTEDDTQYFKAFEEYMNMTFNRFQKVWLHNEILYKLLGPKKKEDELVKTLKRLTDQVLLKNKSSPINGKITVADHNYPTSEIGFRSFLTAIRHQTEKDLTEQEIREELDTTIVATYDTSYIFFISLLVLIGSYPEIQEKMYEEIMHVVGRDRDVEKDDLQKLVYTDAVIKESFRFLPPVPAIARYIDKDVKLKNYTLRAGSQCLILLNAMLRHPSWGADAHQFRPERWLDPATLPQNSSISATFSIGKRSCIGRTYAMVSAKVSVVHVVRKYRLTADHTKMQFIFEALIKPVAGHEIGLQRRN